MSRRPSALVRMMSRSCVKGNTLKNARRVGVDVFGMTHKEWDEIEKRIRKYAKIKVKGVRGEE